MGTTKLDPVEQSLIERDKLLIMLKTNLEVAQNKMKVQANKHKSEMKFFVGDFVYLKLIPYQLQSLTSHTHPKLHHRLYGFYALLERIGSVAYKLRLPARSSFNLFFMLVALKSNWENAYNHLHIFSLSLMKELCKILH